MSLGVDPAVQAVIDELERTTQRKEFWMRVALALCAAFVIISISGIGYTVNAIRDTQQAGSPSTRALLDLGKENKKIGDRLIDCTTPGGECYEQGQTRQKVVLELLGFQFISAVYCNNHVPGGSIATIEKCMKTQSEKRN